MEVSSGGTVPPAATITWTNKDTTTMGLSNLTSVADDCTTYLGLTPSIKEAATSTITGGTSKLTVGDSNVNDACVYIVGTQVFIGGGGSTL